MAQDHTIDIDDEAQREAERAERQREALLQQENDIKWLMDHKQGRRIMARLMAEGGIYKSTFRPNSEMPYLEGRRALALQFFGEAVELAPEKYILMLNEQVEAKEHGTS